VVTVKARNVVLQSVSFFTETFRSFVSVVLKLAITVFFSLYVQRF